MQPQTQSKSLLRLRLRVPSHPCAAPKLFPDHYPVSRQRLENPEGHTERRVKVPDGVWTFGWTSGGNAALAIFPAVVALRARACREARRGASHLMKEFMDSTRILPAAPFFEIPLNFASP